MTKVTRKTNKQFVRDVGEALGESFYAARSRRMRKHPRNVEPTATAHCGYLSGVMGEPEKAPKGAMDVTVLSGAEAALAGLYAARRGV